MATQGIVSPDEQRVSFVELFFDLVFVFSVTKVVELLHHHLSWLVVAQVLLVFWIIWWAWTQFTWALNAADTTHPGVQLGALVATAVAFLMVASVAGAFQDRALWFAITYVLVRLIGLGLYAWVAWRNRAQWRAVWTFSAVSLTGLAAVLSGAAQGGGAQLAWWSAAIALDLVAAGIGGRQRGWNLHAAHFSERHGLFVIIALGESLIVAATGMTERDWTTALVLNALLTVATAGALWWGYFGRAKDWLEHELHHRRDADQSRLARDAFSLLHFPMIVGIIAYAAAIEVILSHPDEPLSFEARALLSLGILLFSGFTALAVRRCGYRLLWPRLVCTGAAALAVAVLPDVPPALALAIMLLGMAATAVIEQRADPVPSPHGADR